MTHPKSMTRPQRKSAFLEAFSACGNVSLACKVAGIGRKTHYRWLQDDPKYAEAFEEAEQAATDRLEAEAWRRAVEGVEKPTGWYKGQAGGTVREYSDTLLIFLLKGMKPEKNGLRECPITNVLEVTKEIGTPKISLARRNCGLAVQGGSILLCHFLRMWVSFQLPLTVAQCLKPSKYAHNIFQRAKIPDCTQPARENTVQIERMGSGEHHPWRSSAYGGLPASFSV